LLKIIKKMFFKKEKILSDIEEIAQELKITREKKKLNLKDLSRQLNINIKYLEALESGNLEVLPSGIFDKTKRDTKQTEQEKKLYKNKQDIFSKQIIKGRNFLIFPKILKNIIILVFVFICFFYLGIYFKKIVYPPDLIILKPISNVVTKERSISVIGKTESEAQVTINDNFILLDKEGNFNKKINLKKGINIITITVKRKYGVKKIVRRQILVK